MDGQIHIRRDLRNCSNLEDLKSRAPAIVDRILATAINAGVSVNDYQFRPFAPEEGYTLFVAIEESHFEIQTWPEKSFVNFDVMVCNFTRNNMGIARILADRLQSFFGGIVQFADETMRGPWDDESEKNSQ